MLSIGPGTEDEKDRALALHGWREMQGNRSVSIYNVTGPGIQVLRTKFC